jgi:AcrR family transcriptional regulator
MRKTSQKPKQQRSKNLVEYILQAGTQMFERIRFEQITTNKIAELAGVSVGSIYQYFSDKKSLFSVIVDRRFEENRNKLQSILSEAPIQEFDPFVRSLITRFLDHLLEQKGYLRALIYFQFELKKNNLMIDSRWKMSEILANEFSKRFDWLKDDSDLQEKFFYLINSGFGVVYLYSQVEDLPMSVEKMKEQMCLNVISYLGKK